MKHFLQYKESGVISEKRTVHMIKHVNFQLYRAHSDGAIITIIDGK